MKEQTPNQVRLIIDAAYDLNGELLDDMKDNIASAINREIGNGMFTGSSAAEVTNYTVTVTTLSAPADELHPHQALGLLIDMAKNHVEDIRSGLQDGTYDKKENLDIGEKEDAILVIGGIHDRLVASLEVCDGVDLPILVGMGVGSMARQRDHAFFDRMLYAEMRGILIGLLGDIETSVNPLSSKVVAAKKLIAATEPDTVGRPAGKLIRFIDEVANLKKWDDGNGPSEMDEPSDGMQDSHVALMGLIDEARSLTTIH